VKEKGSGERPVATGSLPGHRGDGTWRAVSGAAVATRGKAPIFGTEKYCPKCRETKPVESFAVHRSRHDGRQSACRACKNAKRALLRASRKDIEAAYNRDWHKRNDRAYREANREKVAARHAVANALENGSLVKAPCEVCGEAKSEAHHEDYSKPLDVNWLCRKHHEEADSRLEARQLASEEGVA
jgi:hypothetical protein